MCRHPIQSVKTNQFSMSFELIPMKKLAPPTKDNFAAHPMRILLSKHFQLEKYFGSLLAEITIKVYS